MRRCLLPLLWLLVLVPLAVGAEVVEAPASGFRLTIPDIGWDHAEQLDASGLMTIGVGPPGRGGLVQLSIQTSTVADDGVEATRNEIATLRATVAGQETITIAGDLELTVAGRAAPGLVIDQAAYGQDFRVHLVFLRTRGMQYRIQFHAPEDEFDAAWPRAAQVLAGFELVALDDATRERTQLRALAARCGSRVEWAGGWDDASRRARDERRLVVVAVHAAPGFAVGAPLDESVFTDEDVIALMRRRFVGLRWRAGMPAPFVRHDVFGLSGSTFGTGLLVCTPAGDVVRQIYILEPTLVGDALRDVLREHATLAPPPTYDGDDRAGHVAFLLDSGQLAAARTLLGAGDDLPLARARLYRIERNAPAALAVLAGSPPTAAAALVEARVRIGSGDDEGAARALEACLARDPDDDGAAEARLLQGLLAWAGGDADRGRTIWTAVTRDLPEAPAAWIAAAGLVGPALDMGVEPELDWPDAATRHLSRLPRAAPQTALAPAQARRAAVDWLLAAQRSNGAWACPHDGRTTNPAPDPIAMASQAIAITALARVASATEDEARRAACRRAVRAGTERYLAFRALGREHPRPVVFMDYTCWGSSYGLLCMVELLTHPAAAVGDHAVIRREAATLVADLLRIQQANGGWSYYVTGRVDGEAAIVAMSFTTATVLLALDAARTAGIEVPDDAVERGLDRLAAMRGPNGNFEYMRMGMDAQPAPAVAPAGAAARGPVCTLALWRGDRLDAAALGPAFATYVAHLPSYGDQSRKALMHAGPAGQGSHYLLYDYSTAAQALRAAKLDDDARHDVRRAILRELARGRSADGSFIDNPLIGPAAGTGLAVWTLLDLE